MIYVTVPNRGWIHKDVASVILNTIALDARYPKAIDFPALHPPYDNFLNQAAKMVRDTDYFEWWLNIDADNPPEKNPLDLIELGKQVVSCPTPVWQPPLLKWNVYDQVKGNLVNKLSGQGLVQVDAIGTGCILIHRNVLQRIEHPFLSFYNRDGVRTHGPDISFSRRAKEAGIELWAHFDYPCRHMKEVNLLDFVKTPTLEMVT